jgi:hypothetical protein
LRSRARVQHADEDLFYKTKYGRFAAEPADLVPAMPAFSAIVDDHQIIIKFSPFGSVLGHYPPF